MDEDGSKEIEFSDFVHVIQLNKSITEKNSDEQDTLDAFVALGGNVSPVIYGQAIDWLNRHSRWQAEEAETLQSW